MTTSKQITANTATRHDAREVVAHEFGHLELPCHKRKISARARRSDFGTSKRAAKDQLLKGNEDKFNLRT
jgi:hypothetical protein